MTDGSAGKGTSQRTDGMEAVCGQFQDKGACARRRTIKKEINTRIDP